MNSIIVAEPNPAERSTGSLLLDRLWQAARKRGDSQPTADRLVDWARRFILFRNKRHRVSAFHKAPQFCTTASQDRTGLAIALVAAKKARLALPLAVCHKSKSVNWL